MAYPEPTNLIDTNDGNTFAKSREDLIIRTLGDKKAIARVGGLGTDWGAYEGSFNEDPLAIYAFGQKLPKSQAAIWFPGMAAKYEYRD